MLHCFLKVPCKQTGFAIWSFTPTFESVYPNVLNCEETIQHQINLGVHFISLGLTGSLSVSPSPFFSCGQEEPTYSALWGDNKAFNEVIISPAMLNEHMPHMVMEGLNKVCVNLSRQMPSFEWGVFETV